MAGVVGGCGGIEADGKAFGGTSRSGELRDAGPAELAGEEINGVLALRLPKRDRDEVGGCSGSSEVGLAEVGDVCGDGDLFLPKEVERNRDGRLEGVGALCRERVRGMQRMNMLSACGQGTRSDKRKTR